MEGKVLSKIVKAVHHKKVVMHFWFQTICQKNGGQSFIWNNKDFSAECWVSTVHSPCQCQPLSTSHPSHCNDCSPDIKGKIIDGAILYLKIEGKVASKSLKKIVEYFLSIAAQNVECPLSTPLVNLHLRPTLPTAMIAPWIEKEIINEDGRCYLAFNCIKFQNSPYITCLNRHF